MEEKETQARKGKKTVGGWRGWEDGKGKEK